MAHQDALRSCSRRGHTKRVEVSDLISYPEVVGNLVRVGCAGLVGQLNAAGVVVESIKLQGLASFFPRTAKHKDSL